MRDAAHADADPVLADALPRDPVEDLTGNARLALAQAPTLCRAEPGRDACDWYHGFYPLLRCLGAAASPERHARFYARTILPLARRGGFDRVLIPGAADAGMLRCVFAIQRAAGTRARVRVLDRCATPLLLCRRFAERCGTPVETEVFDLLGCVSRGDPELDFDIACTHSLLAFFAPAQRRAGIEACRAQLRPGGKLVSTARIDPAACDTGTRFTPSSAHAFAARIREAAVAAGDAAGLAPDAVFEMALGYAARMVSWPYASADALALDFEASGFDVEQLEVVEVPGHLAPGVAGAGTHQRASYAEFVVSRV